jgi:hypothetical protein
VQVVSVVSMIAHTCDIGPKRECKGCARDRKQASRERATLRAIGATTTGARVLVGNAYLAPRGEWRGVPYVVRFNAAGEPVEVLYTLRGTAPMRAAMEVESRDPAYADGVGDCHDGRHASSAPRERRCECRRIDGTQRRCLRHRALMRHSGTYVPRDAYVGLDTVPTRAAADADARHRARMRDDDEFARAYRAQERGATTTNSRRDDERALETTSGTRAAARRIGTWSTADGRNARRDALRALDARLAGYEQRDTLAR